MARLRFDPSDRSVPYSNRQFFGFLWRHIRPYRKQFFVAATFRFLGDVAYLYPAYALALIVDILTKFHSGDPTRPIWTIAVIWTAVVVIRIVIGQFLAKLIGFRVAARVGLDIQLEAARHLFQLDMAWHEKENAGNKLKRIERGGTAATQIIRMVISNFIEIAVNFIGMTLIIFNITPGLGIALFFFIASYAFIAVKLTKQSIVMENAVNAQEESVHGLMFEGFANIRTVKALAIVKYFTERLGAEITALFVSTKRRIFLYQSRYTWLGSWGHVFRLGAMFFIIYGITRGWYQIGLLILFQSYFLKMWESVGELSDLMPDVVAAKYAIARTAHILDEPILIASVDGKVPFPKDWKTIRLDDLSFAYDKVPVLQNISFTIQRGERIGIVGLSGAGKSTLFKLLLKEHEGYQGNILFDSASLRGIQKDTYLESLAAVLQDTEVFNFTLQENITLADPGDAHDASRLEQALETAHVRDFLHKLPQGLDTPIGEKGFRLSGGEKQRVGIARAIYKRPQILLLDEATSHLDLESEKKIQDSLHQFFQSVTAIVIAHRLTTIKEMDRILVIEGGRIVESGSFAELQKKRGRFHELWEQQRL